MPHESKFAALRNCFLEPVVCYVRWNRRDWLMDRHAAWPFPSWMHGYSANTLLRIDFDNCVVTQTEHWGQHRAYPSPEKYKKKLDEYLGNVSDAVPCRSAGVRVRTLGTDDASVDGQALDREDGVRLYVRESYMKTLRALASRARDAGRTCTLAQAVEGGEQLFLPARQPVILFLDDKPRAMCAPLNPQFVEEEEA